MRLLLLILSLASVFGQRTNIMERPSANYAAGSTNALGQFIVRNQTNLIVSLSRETWPRAATAARVECDVSHDGGTTWITNIHTLTTTGGALTNKEGELRTNSLSIRSLNPNVTNLVRTRLIVWTNLTTRVEVR